MIASPVLPVPILKVEPIILEPVIFPLACTVPATLIPVVAATTTFGVPPTDVVTLPPELTTLTFEVPFCILVASIPVNCEPLPKI